MLHVGSLDMPSQPKYRLGIFFDNLDDLVILICWWPHPTRLRVSLNGAENITRLTRSWKALGNFIRRIQKALRINNNTRPLYMVLNSKRQ